MLISSCQGNHLAWLMIFTRNRYGTHQTRGPYKSMHALVKVLDMNQSNKNNEVSYQPNTSRNFSTDIECTQLCIGIPMPCKQYELITCNHDQAIGMKHVED